MHIVGKKIARFFLTIENKPMKQLRSRVTTRQQKSPRKGDANTLQLRIPSERQGYGICDTDQSLLRDLSYSWWKLLFNSCKTKTLSGLTDLSHNTYHLRWLDWGVDWTQSQYCVSGVFFSQASQVFLFRFRKERSHNMMASLHGWSHHSQGRITSKCNTNTVTITSDLKLLLSMMYSVKCDQVETAHTY